MTKNVVKNTFLLLNSFVLKKLDLLDNFIALFSTQQRQQLEEIISRNAQANWVIDAGFTPISESKKCGEYQPHWGKLIFEDGRGYHGLEVSTSEQETFENGLGLSCLLAQSKVESVEFCVSLSDAQWYKITTDDAELLPSQRRKALLERIDKNPNSYLPPTYRHLLEAYKCSAKVVIQSSFSTRFQRAFLNKYTNLHKKNKQESFAYADKFHRRMFVKNNKGVSVN